MEGEGAADLERMRQLLTQAAADALASPQAGGIPPGASSTHGRAAENTSPGSAEEEDADADLFHTFSALVAEHLTTTAAEAISRGETPPAAQGGRLQLAAHDVPPKSQALWDASLGPPDPLPSDTEHLSGLTMRQLQAARKSVAGRLRAAEASLGHAQRMAARRGMLPWRPGSSRRLGAAGTASRGGAVAKATAALELQAAQATCLALEDELAEIVAEMGRR